MYIKEYDDGDAAAVAQMWNESDEGWPGGFTGGVPFTAERIILWHRETRAIAIYLMKDGERVVGYCSLMEYADEPTAAYVELLNCHPGWWGKGVGRDLLKRAVLRSAELGYRRLDLHTWPGNLRAIPLYKKVGFFWEPGSNVHMMNFVPLALQLAPEFFAEVDWYAAMQRDLSVTEDAVTWRGVSVYPYIWQKDGRLLKMIIDRHSRGVTALETEDMAVSCSVNRQDMPAGLPGRVSWEFVNKQGGEMAVSLLARGEEGLPLEKRAAFVVHDRVTVEADVIPSPDLRAHPENEPAHTITSTVVIGGRLLILQTGVRPQPPVAVAMPWQRLLPGSRIPVIISLRNNLDQPVRAMVYVTPPLGLEVDPLTCEAQMEAGALGGVQVGVKADRPTTQPIQVVCSFEYGGTTVRTSPQPLPIVVGEAGRAVGHLWQETAILENDRIRLVMEQRGGHYTLYDTLTGRAIARGGSTLGPPYDPDEFRSRRFSISLEESEDGVQVVMTAPSTIYPGVIFERRMIMNGGPLVRVEHGVINTGIALQRLAVQSWIRPEVGTGRVVVPTRAGVIADQSMNWPDWAEEADYGPEVYQEGWVAHEGARGVLGIIWSSVERQRFREWVGMPELILPLGIVPSQARRDAPPLYLYAGPGTWHDVRAAWRTLCMPTASAEAPRERPALQVDVSPMIAAQGQGQRQVVVDNQRRRALTGVVHLHAPTGWSCQPERIPFQGIRRGEPATSIVQVRTEQPAPGIARGHAHIAHELFSEDMPVAFIHLGSGPGVRVLEGLAYDHPLLTVDNGWLEMDIAPRYAGGMVSLRSQGREHLRCPFPETMPLAWMNPWRGGISPALFAAEDREAGPGNPGRLGEEGWIYTILRDIPAMGAAWSGVRVSSHLQGKDYRGVTLGIDYLTCAGSNVVALVARLTNTTQASLRLHLNLGIYPQPNGTIDGMLVLDGMGRVLHRVPHMAWGALIGRWGAAMDGTTGLAVVLVASSPSAQVALIDIGQDGGGLYLVDTGDLDPGATRMVTGYLVLALNEEQARLYQVLERVPWPGA